MEERREKEWEAAESFLFPGIHFLNKLWDHLLTVSVFLFVSVAALYNCHSFSLALRADVNYFSGT